MDAWRKFIELYTAIVAGKWPSLRERLENGDYEE